MLADVLLGYPHYAPATLIIKATEGAIVGFLSRKKPNFSPKSWKAFTFLIGLIIGVSLSTIGAVYYTGEVELALGIPQLITLNTVLVISPVFWYVIVPLSRPVIASAMVVQAMRSWNEFMFALTFVESNDLKTLPIGIMSFTSALRMEYTTVMAGLTIAAVPIIVVFLLAQRYFVRGLAAGALKG